MQVKSTLPRKEVNIKEDIMTMKRAQSQIQSYQTRCHAHLIVGQYVIQVAAKTVRVTRRKGRKRLIHLSIVGADTISLE
jgi:hypothetical protein